MKMPKTPFVEPETSEDAHALMRFLTEVAYVHAEMAKETEDIAAQGLTLWAMREFHSYHAWCAEEDIIPFPKELVDEHLEKAGDYHECLVEFFSGDDAAANKFSADAARRMKTTYRTSDP